MNMYMHMHYMPFLVEWKLDVSLVYNSNANTIYVVVGGGRTQTHARTQSDRRYSAILYTLSLNIDNNNIIKYK